MTKEWLKIGLVAVMMILSGISCSRDKTAKQAADVKPPEHDVVAKQYLGSLEESKKIVVAKVNGAEISMKDLIDRMNQIAPRYAKTPADTTPEIDKRVKKDALDVLIFRELAVQEAMKRGMKVEPGAADQAVEAIKANVGSEKAFRQNLAMTGMTEESFRKTVEKDLLFGMIAEMEIIGKAGGDGDRNQAIEKRKQAWEAELKKGSRIEINLGKAEKDIISAAGKE